MPCSFSRRVQCGNGVEKNEEDEDEEEKKREEEEDSSKCTYSNL